MGSFTVAGSGTLDCMKHIMDSLKHQAVLTKSVMSLVHPTVFIQIYRSLVQGLNVLEWPVRVFLINFTFSKSLKCLMIHFL